MRKESKKSNLKIFYPIFLKSCNMSQCYICLEEINPDLESGETVQRVEIAKSFLPCDCNHYAHVDCLFKWIKTKRNAHRCEMVRQSIKTSVSRKMPMITIVVTAQ